MVIATKIKLGENITNKIFYHQTLGAAKTSLKRHVVCERRIIKTNPCTFLFSKSEVEHIFVTVPTHLQL